MWSSTLGDCGASGAAVLRSVALSAAVEAAEARAAGAGAAGLDRTAFQGFYDRTARRLWAYLARASGDPSLADDLTQEAYLRFLRSGFVGDDEDHRRGYLFRIGTNLLRDRRRRAWREVPAGDAGDAQDSVAAVERAERSGAERVSLRRDLSRALGRLDTRQRQLVWLAHVEGASHREIAGILGVRETSVRPMLFRARQKMAALLRADGLAAVGTS